MKNTKDPPNTQEIKLTIEAEQREQQNDTVKIESGSLSSSSNNGRKVSREDIELVQNLIERCLQLYMNKDEVVMTLLNRARIDPGFTTLVWQKLEEENPEFFRAYCIRLKLKKQIIMFNHLLEHQCHLMKYPMPPKVSFPPPIHNGIHPMPVNNLPMGYPVIQQPPVPALGQAHVGSMRYSTSGLHVVNGVPAPGNFHPMQFNSTNDLVIDTSGADLSPTMPPNNGMSDMPVSPTSGASSGHFPFSASEISGLGVDTAFTSDVTTSVGIHLPSENGDGSSRDSLGCLSQIPWNFSLSDLTADLSNLGDLGALGNYDGSLFLPSDSDILLDSPEPEDIVEDFFVDSVPGPPCLPSDEEKS